MWDTGQESWTQDTGHGGWTQLPARLPRLWRRVRGACRARSRCRGCAASAPGRRCPGPGTGGGLSGSWGPPAGLRTGQQTQPTAGTSVRCENRLGTSSGQGAEATHPMEGPAGWALLTSPRLSGGLGLVFIFGHRDGVSEEALARGLLLPPRVVAGVPMEPEPWATQHEQGGLQRPAGLWRPWPVAPLAGPVVARAEEQSRSEGPGRAPAPHAWPPRPCALVTLGGSWRMSLGLRDLGVRSPSQLGLSCGDDPGQSPWAAGSRCRWLWPHRPAESASAGGSCPPVGGSPPRTGLAPARPASAPPPRESRSAGRGWAGAGSARKPASARGGRGAGSGAPLHTCPLGVPGLAAARGSLGAASLLPSRGLGLAWRTHSLYPPGAGSCGPAEAALLGRGGAARSLLTPAPSAPSWSLGDGREKPVRRSEDPTSRPQPWGGSELAWRASHGEGMPPGGRGSDDSRGGPRWGPCLSPTVAGWEHAAGPGQGGGPRPRSGHR